MSANTFDFSGKVGLITGGSRGIGHATALLFAQSGSKVVIGDIDPAGSETVEAIKRDRGEAVFIKTDVREETDVKILSRQQSRLTADCIARSITPVFCLRR